MTSSYNLRHRHKQLSPSSKKQLSSSVQEIQKATPKTEHKIIGHKHSQGKIPKKASHQSNLTTGSTTDLQTNAIINNELFNAQMPSRSQIDSAVNLRKNKVQEICIGRQQDNVESALLYESALGRQQSVLKDFIKHPSEIQIGSHKRQYKNIKHPIPISVPYRKFQTQMEQKVVTIINKISDRKECAKQVQKLFNKVLNCSFKDLRNRYFVSGIALIAKFVNMPSFSCFFKPQLVQKIQETYQKLKQKIIYQLGNTQNFFISEDPQLCKIQSSKLIRKVFKILRKKQRNQYKQSIQDKSIALSNQFINNPEGDLREFIKTLAQM